MSGADSSTINLAKACVLVVDSSQSAVDMLTQIMKGFGVGTVHRATSVDKAERVMFNREIDLIVIDPNLREGDGYSFLNQLRNSGCYVPIILVTGHTTRTDVSRARDTGANFVVAKPIAPAVLLERIQWIGRDKRPFVEVGNYTGPDRRFRLIGPAEGADRREDAAQPSGEPTLSQSEIDHEMIKPQRATA